MIPIITDLTRRQPISSRAICDAPREGSYHPGVGSRDTGDAGLGARMRGARRKAGFTQQQVASRIGVEQNTISEYETGSVTPSREALIQFARVVDESVGYLMEGPKTAMPQELQQSVEALILALPRGALRRLGQLAPADRAQAIREIAALLAAKPAPKPLKK